MMFRAKKIFHLDKNSDAALLEQYQFSKNIEIYTELYQRYSALIYGVCLKFFETEIAKDLCMDLFELLQEKIEKQPIQHFKSWLYMVVKNHCLMHLRSLQREEKAIKSIVFMENEQDEHHNWKDFEFSLNGLEKCLHDLNENQQVAVKLFYLQEKCYQEIASETGYDLAQVKSYIQNGKRNLKICIEKYRETEIDR